MEPEADRRYRLIVTLRRSDRPTNFNWHCPRCTMAVANIINGEPVAVSDLMEMNETALNTVGWRCDGRFQGGRCNVWYYFSFGES